jgi:hypothetical protein
MCVTANTTRGNTAGVGFLFLNLILNEAPCLKQKSFEQAAETELMNGFFVNGSIFENACARRSRLTFSARLKHFEGGSEEAGGKRNAYAAPLFEI